MGHRFDDARRRARAALDLFRGDPLASVRTFDGLRGVVEELDGRRDQALAVLIVAAAAAGDHDDEQALRRRALGHDRDDQLRRALDEARYLASRPALRPVPDTGRPALVGRDEVIADLSARIRADDAAGARRILVWLSGSPGVGKSSVARRLAQELDATCDAGQTDLDLVGTPRQPRNADSVRIEVLRRLGRFDRDSPDWARDYARALTTRSAGGRLLLLVDHVDDIEQVRELLPAAGDRVTVIVVSQRRIGPLVPAGSRVDDQREHAHDLPGLPEKASLDLLRDLVGSAAVDRAPADARQLVRSCGGLPLHLVILGGKIAAGDSTLRECAVAVEEQEIGFLDDSAVSAQAQLAIAVRGAPPAVTLALAAAARLERAAVDPVLVAGAVGARGPRPSGRWPRWPAGG